jgi:hypothetical protein
MVYLAIPRTAHPQEDKEAQVKSAQNEFSRTIQYALASNARTARLAVLMLIAILTWHMML